ncbi:MAG: glycosyltransferase family 39 protein [Bacteroidales bacterium]|nr:glycosyltransferase family 39 protein [Bacteroidales bacterium]
MTGNPFEYDAGDSIMYHNAAISVLLHGYNNLGSGLWGLGLSDSGFPFYLSLIYFVFGDHVIIPRLLNALMGAWTVVLVYRLAGRNFGEAAGRLAGIMMMLMPNLIYYCGIHLKETLMVFLLVAFMERADLLLRRKIRVADLFVVAALGAAMFFFRTVLLASMLFALFSMVLFIRRPGASWLQRSIIGLWVVITVWFTFSYRIQAEFEYLLDNIDAQEANMEFKAKREGGNRLATYGSSVVFAPAMFVAPFPTFVNISTQQTQMMLSGGYFVKNVLAFFVVISLISFIRKRQLRKYILILSFLLAYLAILAQSSFALSERFHLPALPFLIILAAYGITRVNFKNQRFYIPYLALMVLVVIAWNVFKLAGRGGI